MKLPDKLQINDFFVESGTILALIAIFFAAASFTAQLDPTLSNPNLFACVLMIFFLIGILILILSYTMLKYAFRFLLSNENFVFLQGLLILIFAGSLYVIYLSLLGYFNSKSPDSINVLIIFISLGVIFLGIFFINLEITKKAPKWLKWVSRVIYAILSFSIFIMTILGFFARFTLNGMKPEMMNFFGDLLSLILLCSIILINDNK